MGMTMVEKILAEQPRRSEVKTGAYIWTHIDGTAFSLGAARLLEEYGIKKFFDPSRVYAMEDHFAPPPTVGAANKMVLR